MQFNFNASFPWRIKRERESTLKAMRRVEKVEKYNPIIHCEIKILHGISKLNKTILCIMKSRVDSTEVFEALGE